MLLSVLAAKEYQKREDLNYPRKRRQPGDEKYNQQGDYSGSQLGLQTGIHIAV